MRKNVCPICGADKPKIIKRGGNHIGLPFTKCGSCGGFYKNKVLCEYSAMPNSVKRTFFVNVFVLFISILFPTIVAGVLFFTCPAPFTLLAIILVPITFFVAIAVRKAMAKSAIFLSNKRCSYKGYLEFLNENNIKISTKRIAAANDYIEIDMSLELFGELTGYENFNAHFPLKLAADYKQYVSSDLVEKMKHEADLQLNRAAITMKSAPPPTAEVAIIENNDISTMEKYIHMVLKKYNLFCSDGRFQNIKIDLITYLEQTSEPDEAVMKKVIFNALKER